ncbi:hypothetical protein LTR95_012474 [Oleoguttula sp. CCFEE 5521]
MARRRVATTFGKRRRPRRAPFLSVLLSTERCPLLDLPAELRYMIYDRVPPRKLMVTAQGHHTVVSPLLAICRCIRTEFLQHIGKRPDPLWECQRIHVMVQNLDLFPVLRLFSSFTGSAALSDCRIDITFIHNSLSLNHDSFKKWLEYLTTQQLTITYRPDWSALGHDDHLALHTIVHTVHNMIPRGEEYESLGRAVVGCDWPAAARNDGFCPSSFRMDKRIRSNDPARYNVKGERIAQ